MGRFRKLKFPRGNLVDLARSSQVLLQQLDTKELL